MSKPNITGTRTIMTKSLQEYKCRSKKVYPTLKKAWMASCGFFKMRGSYNGPYKCPVCRAYHLTHQYREPSDIFIAEFNKWFGQKVL